MKNEQKPIGETLNDLEFKNEPVKDFFYFVWDLFKTGVIVFLIAFSIRYFLIQPFIVEGSSMLPNFVDQEYLLAEKLSYIVSDPKRGDVVIFKPPNSPTQNYIKRIIGLPGDTINIINNQITITNKDNPNSQIISEPYIPNNFQTLTSKKEEFELTLGDNSYFVLGDNREHSSDSREWGILPRTNMIGRAWLTIKPLNRFGTHKRLEYTSLKTSNIENTILAGIEPNSIY